MTERREGREFWPNLQNRCMIPVGTVEFHVEESMMSCHNTPLDFVRFDRIVPIPQQPNVLMDRQRIERQLKLAQENLSQWVKQLDAERVEEKARRKDAKWRSLDADVRTLKRRLIAVGMIEEREAAAKQRKAEKTAASAE